MNLNTLTIAGNLTFPPELKFTAQGKAVCTLRVANNYKSKDTQKTTFIDCTCWEKTAELASQYLVKGSPVILEGRLEQQEWEEKETGKKRSKHILVVNRLHLFPATRPAGLQGADDQNGNGATGGGDGGEAGGAPSNPFA